MENSKDKKDFAKWLEILQQESWHLELLISGFAIFLLLMAYEPLMDLEYQIDRLIVGYENYKLLEIPYAILYLSYFVLIINLIFHVLLRGLWISTIGLRYVSEDIDFDELQFSDKFDRFLRKNIVSFDRYIENLERVCSIVFSFTFLIIFVLISGGLFLLFLIGVAFSIDWVNDNIGDAGVICYMFFVLLFLLAAVIYLLDFITLGWIKRRKRIAKFYYPIYRFFSWLTLAFIYRPIYYNLIDNKFGRWAGFLLLPYLLAFVVIGSLRTAPRGFLPYHRANQSLNTYRYDDIRAKSASSTRISIPSKYIDNGFLEVYVPYVNDENDRVIQMICPGLKAATTGIEFGFDTDRTRARMNADSALLCNAQRYHIYINDSLFQEPTFRFYNHPTRNDLGLLTILDVDYLPRGEHQLKIELQYIHQRNQKDTLIFSDGAYIPFWKE